MDRLPRIVRVHRPAFHQQTDPADGGCESAVVPRAVGGRNLVKADEDHTILEVPLTVGVAGAMLLPIWLALGAVAALAAHDTLVVEKHEAA